MLAASDGQCDVRGIALFVHSDAGQLKWLVALIDSSELLIDVARG